MRYLLLLTFLGFAGCMQTESDDDFIHTVPVTNNPHIIPNHGSGMPMMGS